MAPAALFHVPAESNSRLSLTSGVIHIGIYVTISPSVMRSIWSIEPKVDDPVWDRPAASRQLSQRPFCEVSKQGGGVDTVSPTSTCLHTHITHSREHSPWCPRVGSPIEITSMCKPHDEPTRENRLNHDDTVQYTPTGIPVVASGHCIESLIHRFGGLLLT